METTEKHTPAQHVEKCKTKGDEDKHRSQAAKCKQQWGQEKPQRYQCKNQERNRTFGTEEQKSIHEHQHEHNNNFHTIYNLGPEGIVECRK